MNKKKKNLSEIKRNCILAVFFNLPATCREWNEMTFNLLSSCGFCNAIFCFSPLFLSSFLTRWRAANLTTVRVYTQMQSSCTQPWWGRSRLRVFVYLYPHTPLTSYFISRDFFFLSLFRGRETKEDDWRITESKIVTKKKNAFSFLGSSSLRAV